MRAKLLQSFVLGIAFGIASCGGSADNSSDSSGGATTLSSGGTSGPIPNGGSGGGTLAATGSSIYTGGTLATGGTSNTVNPTTSLGGTQATGGSSSGNAGSNSTGGAATGGKSATGGAAMGGSATGGKSPTGGAAAGGAATGGVSPAGGALTGGTATGGKSATGGVAAGGSTPTGGAATGGGTTTSTTTSDPCSLANAMSGGTKHCSQSDSGSYGSYQWQVWSNQTAGCLTTYDNAGGAFSANWDNSGDFLAGVGLTFDGTKTYQELGTISADFAETHTGTAGALSYIGVYGWMASPSIEFYIVEDAFDNSPPAKPAGGSKLGPIQVDGGAYDVYYSEAYGNPPSYQLYSIRQTSRHCGHISISDQFSKWASLIFVSR